MGPAARTIDDVQLGKIPDAADKQSLMQEAVAQSGRSGGGLHLLGRVNQVR